MIKTIVHYKFADKMTVELMKLLTKTEQDRITTVMCETGKRSMPKYRDLIIMLGHVTVLAAFSIDSKEGSKYVKVKANMEFLCGTLIIHIVNIEELTSDEFLDTINENRMCAGSFEGGYEFDGDKCNMNLDNYKC